MLLLILLSVSFSGFAMLYRLILFVSVSFLQLLCATAEGISHSSHLMLIAAEKGDTKTVVDYITVTGVPINVKNNYGVRCVFLMRYTNRTFYENSNVAKILLLTQRNPFRCQQWTPEPIKSTS